MKENVRQIQARISRNDETALADLYKSYHRKLQNFSRSLVRSNVLAEETVQDVFLKIWTHRDKILEIENLIVYLYVAVKNTSLNALAQKAQQLITSPFDGLEVEVLDLAVSLYELMITEEMLHRMHDAIENLPPRCKMIFKLIREDGLKYKEVSEILNISVKTIDAQMAIAIKRLCQSLQIEKKVSGTIKLVEKNI
jgi:RNA polymerase sigma-70 factor (ECF subfamily)